MKIIKNKSIIALISITLSSGLFSTNLLADNSTQTSVVGGLSILSAPFLSLQGESVQASTLALVGSEFIISSIVEKSSDILECTIASSANASKYVMRISKSVANSAKIAAGISIKVVAESTGHILLASGKIIGFIPNAIGKSLLESTQINK
jgi:hypothetical protein